MGYLLQLPFLWLNIWPYNTTVPFLRLIEIEIEIERLIIHVCDPEYYNE